MRPDALADAGLDAARLDVADVGGLPALGWRVARTQSMTSFSQRPNTVTLPLQPRASEDVDAGVAGPGPLGIELTSRLMVRIAVVELGERRHAERVTRRTRAT